MHWKLEAFVEINVILPGSGGALLLNFCRLVLINRRNKKKALHNAPKVTVRRLWCLATASPFVGSILVTLCWHVGNYVAAWHFWLHPMKENLCLESKLTELTICFISVGNNFSHWNRERLLNIFHLSHSLLAASCHSPLINQVISS